MTIQAYATSTSVVQGGTIDFCISSSLENVTINVTALTHELPLFVPPITQPQALHEVPFDSTENGCRWPVSYSLPIPTDWESSLYRAEFTTSADKAVVEFVVLAKVPGSKILFCWPFTTREAYNQFPNEGGSNWQNGVNLYNSTDYARSRRVSFNRPFDEERTFESESVYNLMRWLRVYGFATVMQSCSSVDLHADSTLLPHYNLLICAGHDEYWSKEMRDNVETFIASGGNVAFFTANACWWQIRFEDQNRTMICYKSGVEDPLAGLDDERVTINWASAPVNRPENSLTGVSYRYGSLGTDPGIGYTVRDATDWVFSDTGLANGDEFGIGPRNSIMGFETDAAQLYEDRKTPTGLGILGLDGTPPITRKP